MQYNIFPRICVCVKYSAPETIKLWFFSECQNFWICVLLLTARSVLQRDCLIFKCWDQSYTSLRMFETFSGHKFRKLISVICLPRNSALFIVFIISQQEIEFYKIRSVCSAQSHQSWRGTKPSIVHYSAFAVGCFVRTSPADRQANVKARHNNANIAILGHNTWNLSSWLHCE